MKIEFLKDHKLGASGRHPWPEAVRAGEKREVAPWLATELQDRGIAKMIGENVPIPRIHTEDFVRERLADKTVKQIVAKLESRGVRAPKSAGKAALIDKYVAEVDPKIKPRKAKPKGGEK